MLFSACLPHNCPHRNLYDLVHACAPAHFFPHTVPAVFCFDQRFIEEIGQIIDMAVRPQNYVTTTPAISTVGPTFRHKFFSAKTDAPTSAASRLCKNFYPIDEHG